MSQTTRFIRRSQPLEDTYEVGDVIWFKRSPGAAPFAAIRVETGWHVTGLFGKSTWAELIYFIGDSEIWEVTELARVQ